MTNETPSGKTGSILANAAQQQNPINLNSIPFDAEIEAVRQQYCTHSGRPLSKVPATIVHQLLTIHGHRVTIEVLRSQQIKCSYDWIWLNHEGLDHLAAHRPKEYFVYACSKLLQDVTLHSELMRLNEAALAWESLQPIDDEILNPINELLRRLLAGYKRAKLNKYLTKLVNKRVDVIASKLSNLTKLQIELTDLIQTLIAKRKAQDEMERGMSVFKMQRMITTLSHLEVSVGRELNDFDIISGKSSEVIHAITGTQYRHAKADNRQKQYSTPTIKVKPKAGLKLKLKFGGK